MSVATDMNDSEVQAATEMEAADLNLTNNSTQCVELPLESTADGTLGEQLNPKPKDVPL